MESTEETYTDRRLEMITVKRVRSTEDGHADIYTTDSGGFIIKLEAGAVKVGDDLILEFKGFNTIGGLRWPDAESWLYRKSDQQFDRDHAEWLANYEREKDERLAANREDWHRRESLLPEWLRDRLQRFHIAGGGQFEREGWGYELAVCELADMYFRSSGEDSDEINEFASKYGTSGNQHDCAKALAQHQKYAEATGVKSQAANFPAGLAPLMKSADYSHLAEEGQK